MEYERFNSMLRKGSDSLAVELDVQQSRRLYDYFSELKRWSKKVNLISKSATDEEIVEKHFLDSLALLNLIKLPSASLIK